MEDTNFENESFAQMLDQSMALNETSKGEIITGTVIRVDEKDVFIDLGLKSEGIIPIDDFINKEGDPDVEIGREVEVLVETSNGSGPPKVSKKKADYLKERKKIEDLYDKGETLVTTVLRRVKGGLICDIGADVEITAFLPNSQIDTRKVENPEKLIGKQLEAKIIQLDHKSIVISRRQLIEEINEERKKETLSTLEEGDIITGTVENIINQGVFVDIGGVTGFIPISELSWGKIKHPSDVLSRDDEVEVKVIKIEQEGERITLSVKETLQDPWEHAVERYTPGARFTGRAVSTTDFGVFVELEPGIEGLVHISELSWTKNFSHPKEIVKVDSPLDVVVMDVNPEERKISLSVRQIEPSPWEIFKDDHATGTRLKGIIKNINEYGIFVEVAEGLVGLVKPDNISWKGRVEPTDYLDTSHIGEEIEVVLLNVDPREQKIALGIKQLSADPWKQAVQKYKPGETTLTGTVKEVKNSFVIVQLENDIEGFMKLSETEGSPGAEQSQGFNVGDEITALVTGFDKKKRQVNLSQRRLNKKLERESVSDFISSQGESSVKLGDLLGEELKSIDN